jgi:hypothetical protein
MIEKEENPYQALIQLPNFDFNPPDLLEEGGRSCSLEDLVSFNCLARKSSLEIPAYLLCAAHCDSKSKARDCSVAGSFPVEALHHTRVSLGRDRIRSSEVQAPRRRLSDSSDFDGLVSWHVFCQCRNRVCAEDIITDAVRAAMWWCKARQVDASKSQTTESNGLAIFEARPYGRRELIVCTVFSLPHCLQAGDGRFVA